MNISAMDILLPEEMARCDQATFLELGVASRAVMESAGRAVVQVIEDKLPGALPGGVLVLCGGGNNGGDGYVVARTLALRGVAVEVYSTQSLPDLKTAPISDLLTNLQSFLALGREIRVLTEDTFPAFLKVLEEKAIVVDAIFGTGFRGTLSGVVAEAVVAVNARRALGQVSVVSIDIPSGINAADASVLGTAVEADITVSLQALKPGQICFPGASYCGEIYVADIGVALDRGAAARDKRARRSLILEEDVARRLQKALPVDAQGYKGTRGHVLVVGGGPGHYGAPQLSAKAALSCGSGLVTFTLPESAAAAVAPLCLELMCVALPEESHGGYAARASETVIELAKNKDALVLGPGMGQEKGSQAVLAGLLQWRAKIEAKKRIPLVLDADALNCLAQNAQFSGLLDAQVVLTPHPGEMTRLCHAFAASVDVAQVQARRFDYAAQLAQKMGCWVLLKGARTVIASPKGDIFVNPAATAILGTAGSGDVLSGMLGALLGAGLSIEDAVVIGVFIHGAGGELSEVGKRGLFGCTALSILEQASGVANSLRVKKFTPVFKSLRKVLPGSVNLG